MSIRRTKLKIVLTEGLDPFTPTIEDCEVWFRYLNRKIFGNKCGPFHSINIRSMKDCWGIAEAEWDDVTNKPKTITLVMSNWFPTKSLFVTILAHEMIHNYQWKHDGEIGHGKTFYVWRDRLADFGLILRRGM